MEKILVSNPPYNMKWSIPPFAQLQPRFSDCVLPPESNANYAFMLTALDMAERAVFLLPCGILTSEDAKEKEIRKYLVEKNYIDAVITCPDRMFEATSIPTCIIVLDKNKTTTDIMMIDMRQTYTVAVREQNGQYGGTSHENRTYKKEVKTFSDEDIEKLMAVYEGKTDAAEFSRNVPYQTIAENDYNLIPSRYIGFECRESVHRSYNDIIADLNRAVEQKNICKLTINEAVAKSLGLYEFGIMQKQARENAKAMNEGLGKLLGVRIAQDDYISLTKNKNEIKFENNSKDEISDIFMLVMQMYKQHIVYLNNEENRYLAELRDALLPDLMSGKINVENI
jgi:type I restriction-modification system DNA methylase subunit